jgi:shikimate kinase
MSSLCFVCFIYWKEMTRIYILGGPGSGKTTLANRISYQLTIPCYELDLIGWEKGVGAERPSEVRLREVHEIALQADWVAEGGHSPWRNELLQRAEQIVWLDLSWNIARWRILTRHAHASLAGTNKHHGLLKLSRFMSNAKAFYTSTQPDQMTRLTEAQALQPYQDKVVHCQCSTDVETFFLRLMANMNDE